MFLLCLKNDATKKKNHVDDVHSLKSQVTCEICGRKCTKNNFKKHKRTHFPQSLYCDECQFSCKKLATLNRHIIHQHMKMSQQNTEKAHKSTRPIKSEEQFQCDICHSWFSAISLVASHKQNMHSAKEKATCYICGTKVLARGLKLHIEKVHEQKIVATCHLCFKTFNDKGRLKNHVKLIHRKDNNNDSKIYKCDICDKVFSAIGILKGHYKTHDSKKKNYQCDECNKWFTFADVKDHTNIVHSSLEFKCELCGKCFKNQKYLNNHTNIHTESNVECKVCSKSCKNKSSLAKHVGQYHSKKPKVQCNHCHKLLNNEKKSETSLSKL